MGLKSVRVGQGYGWYTDGTSAVQSHPGRAGGVPVAQPMSRAQLIGARHCGHGPQSLVSPGYTCELKLPF